MAGAVQSALPDTVCYSIYPDKETDLGAFRELCVHVTSPLVRGYIWQHQPFDLHPAVATAASLPHLFGSIRYGDNVEDEWFVVFLLLEISRQLPRASIKVWDTDGEFLLVEAAYALPRWLEPENSDNRVFIRDGSVHIIPRSSLPASVALPEALQVLVAGTTPTRAADAVQDVIQGRVAPYKEQPLRSLHRARCIVPLPVAQILRREQQLVSSAVEAFYDRDVDSMKLAGRMQQFVPEPERVHMVSTVVCMSRAMYAQLVQQVFQAPPSYPMPPLSSPDFKAAELGMKLTCGFEMMYWSHSASSSAGGPLETDAGWQAYRASLQNSGYFRGLFEGSKEHSKLLQTASDHYLATRRGQATTSPCDRIHEILSFPHDVADFASLAGEGSDDDTWLYNGEENLTRELRERQQEIDAYDERRKARLPEDFLKGDDWDPTDVTRTMQAFVDKMSTYEGAELPTRENTEKAGSISIDVAKFMSELQCALHPDGKNHDIEDFFSEGSLSDNDDLSEEEADSDGSEGTDRLRHAFVEEYEGALDRELASSSIPKSFARAEQVLSRENQQDFKESAPETSELAPLDVDTNLLQSLLVSYASQEGLPGPASNLLGALGLSLPTVK